jgi:hypothetical protein
VFCDLKFLLLDDHKARGFSFRPSLQNLQYTLALSQNPISVRRYSDCQFASCSFCDRTSVCYCCCAEWRTTSDSPARNSSGEFFVIEETGGRAWKFDPGQILTETLCRVAITRARHDDVIDCMFTLNRRSVITIFAVRMFQGDQNAQIHQGQGPTAHYRETTAAERITQFQKGNKKSAYIQVRFIWLPLLKISILTPLAIVSCRLVVINSCGKIHFSDEKF